MRGFRFPVLVFFVSALSFPLTTAAFAQLESPTTRPLPAADVVPDRIAAAQVPVDVAILLDTSNSMDGLIHQAKSQLWTIVQQFARARKNGCAPRLRVALFEYGNTNLPATEGYLRQVVPLGDDLDVLSEALFALTTQGGDEYCGQVIDEALTRLAWSNEPGSYQVIFIAGNEPFTQGPVPYQRSCSRAIGRGVRVNTIHCGDYDEGVRGRWRDGARVGGGESFNIDQDREVVVIRCPQDDEIIQLNEAINGTYLWYGTAKDRQSYASNQTMQDKNARSLSSSTAVGRSVTKSTSAYDNRARDLVDRWIETDLALKGIPEDKLPEEMQKMSPEERIEHVQAMADKRQELKARIGRLSAEREEYLAAERERMATESGQETLGDAIVSAVRKQLAEAGFE